MNAAKRRLIFERLRAANPDPRSELEHSTPYELLVAVVLSAQATDKSVNIATGKLYKVANTPQAMVQLGVEGLTPYIASIGLYRNKAKNVVALSDMLLREHGGEVPRDRESLEKLPGVGRKSANVVMNVAFGEPTIAVDTHVFRVSNRTGLAPGKDPAEVEQTLLKVTPEEFRLNAHHWLILHGRYTCIARLPKCPVCPIVDLCEFKHKTPGALLPLAEAEAAHPMVKGKPPKPAVRPRTTAAAKSTVKTAGRAKSMATATRDATPKPAVKAATARAKRR
jgi:endonuclease III